MNNNVSSRFIAIAAVAAFLGGAACAKAPQEAIDGAKASLQAATDAEAAKYAPESFRAAEDAINSANAEIAAQSEKFALLRSYDQASQLLTLASEAAEKAKVEAEENREKARVSSEAAIQAAKTAIEAAKAAVDAAPAGKGTRAEIEAMRSELVAMETALTEASQMFEAKDYLGAQAKAESVRSQAEAISNDVGQAIAKRRT